MNDLISGRIGVVDVSFDLFIIAMIELFLDMVSVGRVKNRVAIVFLKLVIRIILYSNLVLVRMKYL